MMMTAFLYAAFSLIAQPTPVPNPTTRTVSILDYGAKGDGVANDLVPLQNAAAAAIAAKRPLYIPAGTYNVTFTAPSNSNREIFVNRILVSGDLSAYGDGIGSTVIKCGPNAPTMVYNLFYQNPGTNLAIRDMTIAGPATAAGNGGQPPGSPFTNAIYQFGGPGAGSTTATRVVFTGRFNDVVRVYSGGEDATTVWPFRFTDCDFDSQGDALTIFGTQASSKSLTAIGCRFFTKGLTAAQNVALGGPNVIYGNSMYVHPNVAVHVERCEFYNSVGRAIQHFSGAEVPHSTPISYARFVDCLFDPSLNVGVVSSFCGPTSFRGCTFRNQSYAILAQNSVRVSQCTFEGANLGIMQAQSSMTNLEVSIADSRFSTSKLCVTSAGGLDATSSFSIRGCSFSGSNPGGTTVNFRTNDSCYVDISGCRFTQSCDTAIRPGNTHARVDNCTFAVPPGGLVNYAIYPLGGQPDVSITGCTFDAALRFATNNDTGTPLRGSGNRFGSVLNSFGGIGGRPYDAKNSDLFAFAPGMSPTVLVALASVGLDPNYDRFRIGGTVAISSLTVGESPGRLSPFGAARVTLVFTTDTTLTGGGNLAPATATVRPAGTTATFVYDGATATWREAG